MSHLRVKGVEPPQIAPYSAYLLRLAIFILSVQHERTPG